ncbi:P47 [Plodia interpunctella granulovirus]|uniref:p47 n=1 Tax=Plodia interpunctella granulovirus TaxID=262175 RepID=A0A1L5JGM5_9BBAC|nr:P47 [Plodia interpunctella granulovirus]APO13941.1 P47 [Plodia interpunctella granulovirus]
MKEFRFVVVEKIASQFFPQCVKYIFGDLCAYWKYCRCPEGVWYKRNEHIVVKEGFVSYNCDFVKFNVEAECGPEDLDVYAQCVVPPEKQQLLGLVLKDRWFKGDKERLLKILKMTNYKKLLVFAENCLWERGYEDNYTLGQQLSIRMTTNLIQSGLDFKHHVDKESSSDGRKWNDAEFEKLLGAIKSVADITKRYKWNQTFVLLEIDTNNMDYVMSLLTAHFDSVITNNMFDNVCVIKEKLPSLLLLKKLSNLIRRRLVNVVFVTDTENYIHAHPVFYIYNSMKFYYYCLKNEFVFHYEDYEMIYLIHTIVLLELINGGCMNSFTLEKSPVMHPLELNSRRCNALKRSAAYNKSLRNDVELKVDFVKGKRITTGTHDPQRLVEIFQ